MQREEREWEKMVETKKETLKAVFGDSYKAKVDDDDPTAGIVLKPRDVTAPKDKWKGAMNSRHCRRSSHTIGCSKG